MPQIQVKTKKRPYLWIPGAAVFLLVVATALAIWYIVIPGGESVENTIARAQNVAKIEDKPSSGIQVLEERRVHTLLPHDRAKLELAEGGLYLGDYKYASAIKVLEQARQDGADAVEVETALAWAYKGAGNSAKAREYFQKLVEYYQSADRKKTDDDGKYRDYYQSEIDRWK